MSLCAYCGGDKKTTREHIWPQCILERVPSYSTRYAAKANKIIGSDLTVRDVCRDCNNGPLSELDAYICNLYDRYFREEVQPEQTIVFKYDFGKLTRALLKLCYNSSRTTDIDAEKLRRYASVILGPDISPLGVFIKLATVHSSHIQKAGGEVKEIPARATRSGPVLVTNRNRDGLVVRVVQIDGYRFLVTVTDDIFDRASAVRYLANEGGTWLPRSGEAIIPRPTLSAMEALRGVQDWRHGDQYGVKYQKLFPTEGL